METGDIILIGTVATAGEIHEQEQLRESAKTKGKKLPKKTKS